MKRKLIALVLILGTLLLAGCTSKIPELSEKDQAAVTRYMADSLLKYDVNYQSSLLTAEEKEKAEEKRRQDEEELLRQQKEEEQRALELAAEKEAADLEVVGGQEGNTKNIYTDIDEFLGLRNVTIEYLDYTICDAYPEKKTEVYFRVTATEGHRLLVVRFQMSNDLDQPQNVDISSLKSKFRFSVDDGKYETSLMTLLENDLASYSGEFVSKESKDCVLIIEIPDQDVISNLKMQIKKTDDKSTGIFKLEP